MMSVCNFIVHGAVGEVVWHNSADPGSWYYGWKVNENLNNPLHKHFGIPHVRSIKKEESTVWQHWEIRRLQIESEKIETPVETIIKPTIPVKAQKRKKGFDKDGPIQLTLFD